MTIADQQEDFSKKELKNIQDEVSKVIKDNHSQDDDLSKAIGQFFFYHNKIGQTVEELLLSICPQLHFYLQEKNRLSFNDKFILLKGFIPNHQNIKSFTLLKLLNQLRNKMAHNDYSDDMFDEKEFTRCLLEAFPNFSEEEKIIRIGKAGKITIAIKSAMILSMMLKFVTKVERFGKEHPKGPQLHAKLQAAANDAIYKRVETLFIKIQNKT